VFFVFVQGPKVSGVSVPAELPLCVVIKLSPPCLAVSSDVTTIPAESFTDEIAQLSTLLP
jgi:hypothetical protein